MKKVLLLCSFFVIFIGSTLWSQAGQRVFAGLASIYGDEWEGKPTASGEVYRYDTMTAAHKTLPFGTMLKVTNVSNNRTVIVKVNDRGSLIEGRVLQLSYKAAQELDYVDEGVAYIKAEIISTTPPPEEKNAPSVQRVTEQEEERAVPPVQKEPDQKPMAVDAEKDTKPITKVTAASAVVPPPKVANDTVKVNRMFVIQFGAFKTMDRAQAYQKTLKEKGILTYTAKEGSPDYTLYKVREAHTYRDIQYVFVKIMEYKKMGIEAFAVGKFFLGKDVSVLDGEEGMPPKETEIVMPDTLQDTAPR